MLTTATVRELKPRDKMYEVTCAAMPGFVVRVLPTGKKVFLVRQHIDGKYRRTRIGTMSPTLGVDEARRRAVLVLSGDARPEAAHEPVTGRSAPQTTRQAEPVKQLESRRPTVRELADRYEREFIAVYLKGSSALQYRRSLRVHILPALGDRDFETVTKSDGGRASRRRRRAGHRPSGSTARCSRKSSRNSSAPPTATCALTPPSRCSPNQEKRWENRPVPPKTVL